MSFKIIFLVVSDHPSDIDFSFGKFFHHTNNKASCSTVAAMLAPTRTRERVPASE
jgi:hypothetical protein